MGYAPSVLELRALYLFIPHRILQAHDEALEPWVKTIQNPFSIFLGFAAVVSAETPTLIKDAWNVPILGDPFAFFLDRCK